MSRPQSITPFLVIPEDNVQCDPWMIQEPLQGTLPTALPEWDSATDLRLERHLRLNVSNIWSACGLATDATIAVLAEWSSEGTSLRGCTTPAVTAYCRQADLQVRVSCSGSEQGQALTLRTRIILHAAGSRAESPLAPRQPGSILWSDSSKVILEGQGSRFPMETVDFQHLPGIPSHAGWHLAWSPLDPHLAISAAARLQINQANQPVLDAVTAVQPDDRQQLVRRVVYWDVARRMITGMLDNQDFRGMEGAYEEGTLGAAVTTMISLHLPNESIQGLRAVRASNPDLYDTILQAAFNPNRMD
jgi:hypothetical protein